MIEIKVPVFPESIRDGTLSTWHKKPGEAVANGDVIADIETDKVVFELPSQGDGELVDVLVEEGATVLSGQVVAHIKEGSVPASKAVASTASDVSEPIATVAAAPVAVMPAAERLAKENALDTSNIKGSGKGGRVLKEDVQQALATKPPTQVETPTGERSQKRVPMTRLRSRIAERLVEAQQTAAILTTFNEVNMQPVMTLRKQYREQFEQRHGTRLGFMSFYVTAAVEALKRFPEVNASIEDDDIVYHGFFDIGIAVGTERGLVVPILRDADRMSMAQIELQIRDLGERAQSGRLALEELVGGTFSITNGGVYGSLMSTPILNPPQSGILGMHKIQPRPVVEDDEIVIRPMMYLAFSYDHRIVDGREAVQFLVAIKEMIEDPARILLQA